MCVTTLFAYSCHLYRTGMRYRGPPSRPLRAHRPPTDSVESISVYRPWRKTDSRPMETRCCLPDRCTDRDTRIVVPPEPQGQPSPDSFSSETQKGERFEGRRLRPECRFGLWLHTHTHIHHHPHGPSQWITTLIPHGLSNSRFFLFQ